MTKTTEAVRDDPATALLIASAAALIVVGAATMLGRPAVAIPPVPGRTAVQPQDQWRSQAKAGDVLDVPGYRVAYWGRPLGDKLEDGGRVTYGSKVTRKAKPFRAIAIHYTVNKPVINFVKYQHNGDDDRGGSYGYHVYIGQDGSVWQGAPLSVRTNHIKPSGNRHRSKIGGWADGANTIGVSLVGACKVAGKSITDVKCVGWDATPAQEAAALATVAALRTKYNISRCAVWGHGELQDDRRNYEGAALAQQIRGKCKK